MSGQGARTLYLLKILMRESDREHPLGLSELTEKLAEYGVSAERKALYRDLSVLRDCGFDVVKKRGKTVGYYLQNRWLTGDDLRTLADAVAAADFLPRRRSAELLRRLEQLLPDCDERGMEPLTYTTVRTEFRAAEKYALIRQACETGRRLRFSYRPRGEKEREYLLSVYGLIRSGGLWLCAGSTSLDDSIGFFRLERMSALSVSGEAAEDIRVVTGDMDFKPGRFADGAAQTGAFDEADGIFEEHL